MKELDLRGTKNSGKYLLCNFHRDRLLNNSGPIEERTNIVILNAFYFVDGYY